MLSRSVIERLLPLLQRDCRRALKMHVPGFPRPFFCSFLLRDVSWFNTWASAGSVYKRRSDKKRHVYCDLRVGSYRLDQVSSGGLNDEEEERDSTAFSSVPIDDRNFEGLRLVLWRLVESKFKEALSDLAEKEGDSVSRISPHDEFVALIKQRRKKVFIHQAADVIDEDAWVKFCKKASLWMASLPKLTSSHVEIDASQTTKMYVSSEGRVIVQPEKTFTLVATFRKLAKDGVFLEQELIINTPSLDELPNLRTFKKLALKKYDQLLKLSKARSITSFSGPVLLYPKPAGLLFHEAIGHRLEGNRLLSSGEGQTFKDQIDQRVLDLPVSVRDNPRQRSYEGKKCIGAYAYDDEGVEAANVQLLDKGVLKGFLTSRAPCLKKGFVANGHGRNAQYERPISRMGVTIVESKKGISLKSLVALLVREIQKQGKPFGMIVFETSGGETDTGSYNFQAFSGEVSFAVLVYPDGKQEVVRGVNFVGTPLQALQNIIAVGKESELDNSFCGAESGLIPVTTISPAVLLSSLELQAKELERVTQTVLKPPRIKVARH
jgi:TldD protein